MQFKVDENDKTGTGTCTATVNTGSFGCHAHYLNNVSVTSITVPGAAGFGGRKTVAWKDLSDFCKNQIWEWCATNYLTSGYAYVAFPTLNYGLPSRGGPGAGYVTSEFILWLMKNKGGSWYAGPATRNKMHGTGFGEGGISAMSLVQPVFWYPEGFELLQATRFELHPKGTGKYGPVKSIRDFLNQSPGGAKAMVGKEEAEIRSMTLTDFRAYAKELRA